MSRKKLPVLLVALLFKVSGSLAQSQPAPVPAPVPPPRPDPNYEQVSVPVPRAVLLITDVARVLLSRDAGQDKLQALVDRRRARAEKRDQGIRLSIPKNRLTRTLGLVE